MTSARSANEHDQERFEQEARAQARLDHENICKVYEAGELEGMPYIAMELLEGKPLNALKRKLTQQEKLAIVRDTARALHVAHRMGIVHRDIKPGNIMVMRRADSSIRPVIMDFGLAFDIETGHHLTCSGMVIGTPAYMSPEQAAGTAGTLDARSDIFSLGAVLYELFSGMPPFVGFNSVAILGRVTHGEPIPLRQLVATLPTALEVITMKCLEKEPAQRYQSGLELAADIQRYLDSHPIVARPSSRAARMQLWARRRIEVVLPGGLALLTFCLAVCFLLQAQQAAQRQKAELAKQSQLSQRLGQAVMEIAKSPRCAPAAEQQATGQ